VTEGLGAVADGGTATDGLLQGGVVEDVPAALRLVAPEPERAPTDQHTVVREVDEVDELLAVDACSVFPPSTIPAA
jgi:hypothetical protein